MMIQRQQQRQQSVVMREQQQAASSHGATQTGSTRMRSCWVSDPWAIVWVLSSWVCGGQWAMAYCRRTAASMEASSRAQLQDVTRRWLSKLSNISK